MPKQYHHIMYIYDVALAEENGEWPLYYTTERARHSDSGEFIMVQGDYDEPFKSFDTNAEMHAWAYENGWTKPEVADEI